MWYKMTSHDESLIHTDLNTLIHTLKQFFEKKKSLSTVNSRNLKQKLNSCISLLYYCRLTKVLIEQIGNTFYLHLITNVYLHTPICLCHVIQCK